MSLLERKILLSSISLDKVRIQLQAGISLNVVFLTTLFPPSLSVKYIDNFFGDLLSHLVLKIRNLTFDSKTDKKY